MSKLIIRGKDAWGDGAFGSSRDGGERKHNGVDIVTVDGEEFRSLGSGTITKLGYPYKGNYIYRYVQVTSKDGSVWRYFYVNPSVELGLKIIKGQILGKTQSLEDRYKGITPHVHFEIMVNGKYVDPTSYVKTYNETL